VAEVVDVAEHEQGARDDVVDQHLDVVLAPLLDVDDEDLLHPEGRLEEVVELHLGRHHARRVVGEELAKVHPVVGVVEEVLRRQPRLLVRAPPLTMPKIVLAV
jgi:hypothetical protein